LLLLLYLLISGKETSKTQSSEKTAQKIPSDYLIPPSNKQHQNTSKTTGTELPKETTSKVIDGSSEKEFPELYIKYFGEDIIEEPIDSGYVFTNGQYLDAPYRVIRKGIGYFINDIMVSKADVPGWPWPPPERIVKEDPGFPPGITKDTTLEEMDELSDRKYLYLYQNFPEEVAIQKLTEYYASLPCVRSATFTGVTYIDLVMIDGRKIGKDMKIGPKTSWWDPVNTPTYEEVLEELKEMHLFWEKQLLGGSCIIFFQFPPDSKFGVRYGDDIISPVGVYQGLPEVIEILKSDITLQEKKEEMKELTKEVYFNANLSLPADLSVPFKTTPQLERRINEIKEKRKTDPEFWLKRAEISSPESSDEIRKLLREKSEELGRELTLEERNILCKEYFEQKRKEQHQQEPK